MAQPLKDGARRVGAGIGEKLAGNHLEQIAADKGLLGALDERRIFARPVVAFARPDGGCPVEAIGGGRGRARQPRGRPAGRLELVAMDRRDLPHVVDDQDLVGQVEHKVALVRGPRQPQPHRLELKDEVVAEGAVEPEMLVFTAAEQSDERAQHRKHRGLAAALLLREALGGLGDFAGDPVRAHPLDMGRGQDGDESRQ